MKLVFQFRALINHRVLSAYFLCVFLLYILGYYAILISARHQVTSRLIKNINDNTYSLNAEIIFKVPVAIPYAADMNEYTRVDGEFNYGKEIYRLKGQKLYRDTLYLACVKDIESKGIDLALEDYVKTFSDCASNEKGSHKATQPFFSKDFFSSVILVEIDHPGWELKLLFENKHQRKTNQFYPDLLRPPCA